MVSPPVIDSHVVDQVGPEGAGVQALAGADAGLGEDSARLS